MGATLRSRVTVFLPIVFGICFLIPFTPQPSLAQITFEKTYGGGGNEYGYSVQATSDGGYIIAGRMIPPGTFRSDAYLVKTDSLGNMLWDRIYGFDMDDCAYSIQQTPDGGYSAVGYTWSQTGGAYNVHLLKTDSLGNTLWDTTYGGMAYDRGYSHQLTVDGGFIITGYKDLLGLNGAEVYLIRTDSLGNVLWDTTYGGSGDDYGISVQRTLNGGYIVTGYTDSYGEGDQDVYLIKTDSLGNALWERTYGDSTDNWGCSVQQTPDGGYVVAGRTWVFGTGWHDLYLLKTDSLGDVTWDTTYGLISRGPYDCWDYSVQLTPDGGFIVAGGIWTYGLREEDVYLLKTDSLGNVLWEKTYGGKFMEFGHCVQVTSDGGYVIAGTKDPFGNYQYDVYLIKTDSLGRVVGITEDQESRKSKIENRKSLQNQPNPFHKSTLISYSLPVPAQVTLEIYDITGRLVETLVNEKQHPGIHQVRWDRKANPSGVYFCRLRAGDFTDTKKMILLR